jgi:osmoprotectant transport system substrate-binding protein
VVASFNFGESHLVAEIYAQALEAAGVPVRRELGLGPRELVLPALEQGLVDLLPEYAGTLLATLAPSPDGGSGELDAVLAELADPLSELGLVVLTPAPAVNENGVVVTTATANAHGLVRTSDLAPIAGDLVIGGPPECPGRPHCLLGLEHVYGLRFDRFVPLTGEAQTTRALLDAVVDVGILFTTDGSLARPDLVLLDDDRHLQPPDNLVPVLSLAAVDRYGKEVVAVLDAVSAQLTTPVLRFLNWRVSVGGGEPAAEARGFLVRHQLIPR